MGVEMSRSAAPSYSGFVCCSSRRKGFTPPSTQRARVVEHDGAVPYFSRVPYSAHTPTEVHAPSSERFGPVTDADASADEAASPALSLQLPAPMPVVGQVFCSGGATAESPGANPGAKVSWATDTGPGSSSKSLLRLSSADPTRLSGSDRMSRVSGSDRPSRFSRWDTGLSGEISTMSPLLHDHHPDILPGEDKDAALRRARQQTWNTLHKEPASPVGQSTC